MQAFGTRATGNGGTGKEVWHYDHGEKETAGDSDGGRAGSGAGYGQRVFGCRDAGGTGGADAKRTLYSHQFL